MILFLFFLTATLLISGSHFLLELQQIENPLAREDCNVASLSVLAKEKQPPAKS